MKSIISLTFDDGLRCQFERAAPILNRYGLKGTFFLIANHNSTHDLWNKHVDDWWKIDWRPEDLEMLASVVRDGHEIGSHSVSHHPDKLKVAERADLEVRESRSLIEGWTGAKISSFCYPFYWSHAYLGRAVKSAGYKQARGGGLPPDYSPSNSYYSFSRPAPLDPFNIDCRQISRSEEVGSWLRPGCWHVLTYHAVGDDRDGWEPISEAQFTDQIEQLARYRDAGAVDVLTFAEAAGRFRTADQAKGDN